MRINGYKLDTCKGRLKNRRSSNCEQGEVLEETYAEDSGEDALRMLIFPFQEELHFTVACDTRGLDLKTEIISIPKSL